MIANNKCRALIKASLSPHNICLVKTDKAKLELPYLHNYALSCPL